MIYLWFVHDLILLIIKSKPARQLFIVVIVFLINILISAMMLRCIKLQMSEKWVNFPLNSEHKIPKCFPSFCYSCLLCLDTPPPAIRVILWPFFHKPFTENNSNNNNNNPASCQNNFIKLLLDKYLYFALNLQMFFTKTIQN